MVVYWASAPSQHGAAAHAAGEVVTTVEAAIEVLSAWDPLPWVEAALPKTVQQDPQEVLAGALVGYVQQVEDLAQHLGRSTPGTWTWSG
jgi:hypothetical protein